jgi:hypothetical protein
VRRVRRGVGAGRGGAAAVRAGDVPLRGRGLLLRGERPAGRRVHAVALGAAPLQPPQVPTHHPANSAFISSTNSRARSLGSTRRTSWRGCAASG